MPSAVRPIRYAIRAIGALQLVLSLLLLSAAVAGDKTAAVLYVKDSLSSPNQVATVEARLVQKRLLAGSGLGGEPVELVIDGRVAATAMTGGDGKTFLTYIPKAPGNVPVQVRVGASPRVAAVEGQANLAVWERRNPIVTVEMAALIETPPTQGPLPGGTAAFQQDRNPMPDAAEELAKLTQFLYRVIYVATSGETGSDAFQVASETGEWLKAHKFPTGYVLVLPAGSEALGTKIDELHAAGWKSIKTGIGRTKAFAEAFLQRRLGVVIVPEPVKGEAPRKAKVAKEWKEVRKKL